MRADKISIEFPDKWAVAEGEHEGLPLIIRFRQNLTQILSDHYPNLLTITWQLEQPSEQGLPEPPESDDIKDFEQNLVKLVEDCNNSILAVVISNNGEREFLFYTNDVDTFSELLHKVPQKIEPYPIEISYKADERGEQYQAIGNGLQGL